MYHCIPSVYNWQGSCDHVLWPEGQRFESVFNDMIIFYKYPYVSIRNSHLTSTTINHPLYLYILLFPKYKKIKIGHSSLKITKITRMRLWVLLFQISIRRITIHVVGDTVQLWVSNPPCFMQNIKLWDSYKTGL